VSLKANANSNHDELIDRLKRMSEDIIMEEVSNNPADIVESCISCTCRKYKGVSIFVLRRIKAGKKKYEQVALKQASKKL